MPRPRSDIRLRILDAARERFAAAGVDATSLRSIASDASTSIGMVYYYFPSKDELFLAVIEDVYGRLLGDLEAALTGPHDFASRALALFRRVAAATPLERQVIRLVAREGFTSGQRREGVARRFSRGHVPLIFQAVLAGVQSGQLRSDVHPLVMMAATIALGTLPQIAVRVLGKHLPSAAPEPEELTRQLASVLMHGIAAQRLPAKKKAAAQRSGRSSR
ncbi:MAG TPA: TetR/AcrR family transcriptional regulator [Polyangiaceae bacterium]|nr:TetR/AcrR family transcriptional regulator [Polyangiaceae bacterium]